MNNIEQTNFLNEFNNNFDGLTMHLSAKINLSKRFLTTLLGALLMLVVVTHTQAQSGAIDITFDPNANAVIYELRLQPDGKILAGGNFTSIGGGSRSYLARLNANGTLDNTFTLNTNNRVDAIAVQSNGKILVGGNFNSIGTGINATVGTVVRNNIARINADGSLDTAFNPNPNSTVFQLKEQSDGKILVGGAFSNIAGAGRNGLARLNADGSIDSTFINPNVTGFVEALVIRPDGRIIIVGRFTSVDGQPRNGIAQINADGTLDNFNPNAAGGSGGFDLIQQADGKILIGGDFTSVGGQPRNNIVRFNADGTLDDAFNPNINDTVNELAQQVNGKILVVGFFSSVGGITRNNIARLNIDGTLDTTFNPNVNADSRALAIQTDGKILVGGFFTNIDGQTRNRIARLNADAVAAQPILKADYQFQGNLNSSVAGAPALTNLTGGGTNSIASDTVDGYARQTLRFPQNSGLTVNTSGVIPGNAYTIVMLFKFDTVTGTRRVVDFKNGASDNGAYIVDGQLEGQGTPLPAPLAANTYFQIAVVRDSSGNVRAYRDGVERIPTPFLDANNDFVISQNILRFFQDDNVFGGEASGGNVARIRLFDAPLTTAQLQALDRVPVGAASAQPDIAFYSQRDGNGEIYTVKADGSEQRRLTNNPANDSLPDWSPDGSKIVFQSDRDGNNEIYVMNADGSSLTRLTTNAASDQAPVWSPNGSKIAFMSSRDGNNEIYVMNADGSNPIRITNNTAADTSPSWSPNGSQIAFVSNRDGDSEIFKMNADGTNPVQLTSNTVGEGQPAWSPDGAKIAFWSQRDGNLEIYTMNTDGTSPARLTNNPAEDSKPSWSSDSTKLTFASGVSTAEIYTMNANGTNQTRLTFNSANDFFPDWRGQIGGTVTQCSAIPIAFGQTFSGNLNTGSCVINNRFTDTYTFSGNSGDQIAITMNSNRFKVLELINPAGVVIQTVSVPDYAGNIRIPNNQEYFSLTAAGLYTIRAGTDGESAGTDGSAYSISLYKAPSASPACTYSLSSPRTNVASGGGTFFIDVLTQDGCPPVAAPNRFGRIYSISSFIGGRLTFSVNSNSDATDRQDTITIAGQTHTIFQYANVPPVNDLFGGAAPLFGTSSLADAPVTGYNTGATAEPPSEPAHAGKPAAKSVWYRWTAPAAAGLYSFSTSGSSFDTVMAIYACPTVGDCSLASIAPVGSNDDTTAFDKTSKVNFRASANTTYYIAVDGKNGASGTIQLSFINYERLYRLYLQTYNGDQSPLMPDSVSASNGNQTFNATRISQGVYEFSLPADKTIYRVTISGPTGIVWSVNNFALGTSFSALNELTEETLGVGETTVSNAQYAAPSTYVGFIKNITQQELDGLSVKVGYSRGANPRDPDLCTVDQTAIPLNSLFYARYQCRIQPQTLHDIIPERGGKRFSLSVVSFPANVQGSFIGESLPTQAKIVASDAPTYGISGRVLGGGAGTKVELKYLPNGNTQAITLPTTTVDATGFYEFKNLPPGTYTLKASRAGFVFAQPADVTLQAAEATVDIAVQQACTYEPAQPLSLIVAAGGQSSFTVKTNDSTCEWSAVRVDPWITINSGAAVGEGTVHFTVEANSASARTGIINVGGQNISIQQAGAKSRKRVRFF